VWVPAIVLGVGARGAIGLDARQLALAARAGWLAPRRRAIGESGVGVAFTRSIPASVQGVDRCVRLAHAALEEAVSDAIATGLDRALLEAPAPLAVALPEPRADDDPRFGRPFLEELGASLPAGIDLRRSDVVRAGNAGFAAVLKRAAERLEAAGAAPAVAIVGGVDSHGHDALLADLFARRRILSARAVDGVVPGEAAAFAVLANAAACGAARPVARVVDAAVAQQRSEDDEDATIGEALTALVRGAAAAAPSGRFDWVINDVTPERHRQKEWSFVELRHRAALSDGEAATTRLGEDLGELGAAVGAVALAIAAVGFRTGFAPGPCPLVALASDGGERGAFVACGAA
jgi:3-oxoacyl-[acyl-carrier-protein] synthase-1